MSRPRYVVQTVSGYEINLPIAREASGRSREGVSAHVCDSVYLYEVVASYRNKDTAPVPGHEQRRLGVEGAIAAAEEHAERLNRDAA